MGYRCETSSTTTFSDIAPMSAVRIQNGNLSRLAFPCSYLASETGEPVPIHLHEEGYSDVKVYVRNVIEGLEIDGYIDPLDDTVVRVDIKALCPSAVYNDVSTIFSVVIEALDTAIGESASDVIMVGELTIIKAPCLNDQTDDANNGPFDLDIVTGEEVE